MVVATLLKLENYFYGPSNVGDFFLEKQDRLLSIKRLAILVE